MAHLLLGDWSVRTLETGTLWLDGGAMFGSVPKPLWSRAHPPDDRNRIRLAARVLLAEGHGRRVLVDAGVGDLLGPKLDGIYRVGEDGATLERALAAAGLAPADITDVVLTHLHFDHGGGALRQEGERRLPRLPGARYYVQRRNWENALRPNPRERASYLPDLFLPLEQAGVVTLWHGAATPWPGFEIFTADGHTRGQQLVWIAGGGTALAFVADLIPTASHVRIPFVMGYDVAAIETMEEKRRLLGRAVAEGAWICLEHDPETALARPRAEGDDFAWAERVPAGETDAVSPPGVRT